MKIDKDKILELESDYGISFSEIVRYYVTLLQFPCVNSNSEEKLYDCLETLVQDRSSTQIAEDSGFPDADDQKSFEQSVSDALKRVYEEEAIPYLNSYYSQDDDLDSNMSL
jgi:hypothetical protein